MIFKRFIYHKINFILQFFEKLLRHMCGLTWHTFRTCQRWRVLNITKSHNLFNTMKHFTTFSYEKTWNKQTRINGIYILEQLLSKCITTISDSTITPQLSDHIALTLKVNQSFFFKLSWKMENNKKPQNRAFNFEKMSSKCENPISEKWNIW